MSDATQFVNFVKNQLGKPYLLGVAGPDGYDCSGLIFDACKQVLSADIPRVSSDQYGVGQIIDQSSLVPGDLLFFDTEWTYRKPNHVGVYIGNDSMISASSYYNDVHEESIVSGYWVDKYMGSRRIFDVSQMYSDVDLYHKHYAFITHLSSLNIVSGYPLEPGETLPKFKPEADVNRAELLKMIIEAFGIPLVTTGPITFPDVQETDWFCNYVRTALNSGIIAGYPDGTFKPAQSVIRVEALKMILEASGADISSSTTLTFSDVSVDQWYYHYVQYCFDTYLLPPITDSQFGSSQSMNRGEVAMVISKLL